MRTPRTDSDWVLFGTRYEGSTAIHLAATLTDGVVSGEHVQDGVDVRSRR